MAFPTLVNSQITDSITQANTKNLGDAPAVGMGNLFIATSQALSNSAQNAAFAQLQSWTTMQTATTQGVSGLLTLDTAAVGRASEAIFKSPYG